MRKTKIICTLGPASWDLPVIEDMIEAGMDAIRINFSHGDRQSHRRICRVFREASERAGKPLPMMGDLQGPRIRVGEIDGRLELAAGDRVILCARNEPARGNRIGTTYRFVTLFMMIFDGEKGVVRYATAGHPPPLLIHGDDGRTQWLEVEGSFPLGLEKDTRFPETEFDLKPNDTIVLYSDGLTDAQNPDRAAYGEARIEAHLAQCGGLSPEDIVSGMRSDLEIHRQGQEATDDTTIVAVQYRPEGGERAGESGEAASG